MSDDHVFEGYGHTASGEPVHRCITCGTFNVDFIVRARCATLVEALRVAEEALRVNTTTWLALEPALGTPYPDDPRWTPWTRFGERAGRKATNALTTVRDALAAYRAAQGAGRGAE